GRAKLVWFPSKPPIPPSTTKSSAPCRGRASSTSGYWLATDSRLRDRRRVREPCRKAKQRSPSSLRSKIHPGSENRRSVSVASIGPIQSGCGLGFSPALASSGSPLSGSLRGIEHVGEDGRVVLVSPPCALCIGEPRPGG